MVSRLEASSKARLSSAELQRSDSNFVSKQPTDLITRFSAPPAPPLYISEAAASELLGDRQKERSCQDDDTVVASINFSQSDFSERALRLLNAFLDHILYQILAVGRAPTYAALRPAVEHVLKGRLARQAIGNAEEELSELLAEGEAEEELALIDEQAKAAGDIAWDVENTWKRTRLRIMVYTRYGEMPDEDEERLVEAHCSNENPAERRFLDTSGLVTWIAAIFLTSILEYITEQCVDVTLEAVLERTAARNGGFLQNQTLAIVVQDSDVERIARSTTLGRLWRTWKQGLRSSRTPSRSTSSAQSSLQEKPVVSPTVARVVGNHSVQQDGDLSQQRPSLDSQSDASPEVSPLKGLRETSRLVTLGNNGLIQEHTYGNNARTVHYDFAMDSRPASAASHELTHNNSTRERGSSDGFNFENMLLSSAPTSAAETRRDAGIASPYPDDSTQSVNSAAYAGTLVERLHHGAAVLLPEQMNLPIQSSWTDGEVVRTLVPGPRHTTTTKSTRERPTNTVSEPLLTPPQEQQELEVEDVFSGHNRANTSRIRPQSTEVDRNWINNVSALSPRNNSELPNKTKGLENFDVKRQTTQSMDVADAVRSQNTTRFLPSNDPIDEHPDVMTDSLTDARIETDIDSDLEFPRVNASARQKPSSAKTPLKGFEARDLTSRPPLDNTRRSAVLGLLAREPRVQTEPLGDLADWVRSTNPPDLGHEHVTVVPSRAGTPGSENGVANGSQISQHSSSKVSRKKSVKTGDAAVSRTRSVNKPRLEAREAVVRTVPANELIDLIREGPPGAAVADNGQPPRDSTQSSIVRPGSRASGSLPNGYATSYSGLIATSGAHRTEQPAYSDRPQLSQSPPPPSSSATRSATKPRRRVRDPYAIDSDDEEDDVNPTALPTRSKRESESLMDFLKTAPPSSKSVAQPVMAAIPVTKTGGTFQTSALAPNKEEIISPPKRPKNSNTRIRIPSAAFCLSPETGNRSVTPVDRASTSPALRHLTLTPPIARAVSSSALASPHTGSNTPTYIPSLAASRPATASSMRSNAKGQRNASQSRSKSKAFMSPNAASSVPDMTLVREGASSEATRQGQWARMGAGLSDTDIWDPLAAEPPVVGLRSRSRNVGSERGGKKQRMTSASRERERNGEGVMGGRGRRGSVGSWMRRMGSGAAVAG